MTILFLSFPIQFFFFNILLLHLLVLIKPSNAVFNKRSDSVFFLISDLKKRFKFLVLSMIFL
jgi:hypothetical protein